MSLQSGVGYELDEDEVRRVFSQLGPVRTVQLFKRPRKGVDGFVGNDLPLKYYFSQSYILLDFASPLSARAALNRNLEVGQCCLFTMMPWTAVTQVMRIIVQMDARIFGLTYWYPSDSSAPSNPPGVEISS